MRQQRKGKEQRDPSPQLMPSSQASRKKVVDEPKAGCEKGTPQMRAGSALSRKSPMNRQPKEGGCGNLYQEEFFKADRSVSYEKSKNNKKILKNALTYVCLAGEPNKKERDLFIQRLEQSDCEHVILLFKAYGRMVGRVTSVGRESAVRIQRWGSVLAVQHVKMPAVPESGDSKDVLQV